MAIVAPSLLAADFLHLADACTLVNESQADWFHLDVMDGRFVPNISFGMSIVQQIKSVAQKPCDVHLMIEEPGKYAADFQKAGADHLIVHYEACPHLHRNIQQIKDLGMKAGVAINPHTAVESLLDVLQDLDIVLIMSVNPGFGGQTFIQHTYYKIKKMRQLIHGLGLHTIIAVDGGVTLENAPSVVNAGADSLIAGSTVFHAPDPKGVIKKLKGL
jgi:ribulose-phosphate 3-epimerase